jgi:hypothetical protein
MPYLRNFWNTWQGQHLIEHSSTKGIWSTTNSRLVAANTSAG